jgi:hypothetical protein
MKEENKCRFCGISIVDTEILCKECSKHSLSLYDNCAVCNMGYCALVLPETKPEKICKNCKYSYNHIFRSQYRCYKIHDIVSPDKKDCEYFKQR